MMPFKLSITIGAEVFLLLFSAIYFAIHDSQEWKFITPFFNICIVALLYAYVKKIKYSNFLVIRYCHVGILLMSLYLLGKLVFKNIELNTEFYLLVCEYGVLLLMLHVLKQKEVVDWFNNRGTL